MRLFGLIGYPLSHSFSKKYFTEKFEKEGVEALYENYPISSIEQFSGLLAQQPALEGINVTIPYKEAVIPFLHKQSEVVKKTGACNCIRIRNGVLEGFNTDVVGFEQSLLKSLDTDHNRALVLGTGGASKAVQYVLEKLGIPFTLVSRKADPSTGSKTYAELSFSEQQAARLWINTTPLGMFPDITTCPPMQYDSITPRHYLYDLVYNPAETAFLTNGKDRGAIIENGKDMLLIQAEEGWKIWNSD
ncbi:shikimate dehydrogenase [Flavihumibacter sp. CACIAM 22H1]|uniref:shikimate dehydrogenase family protein n=1 Tax=Flavihumibacter sp. CACIAM 22H1 TaxID=1812911 RepID=UPI0007A8D5A1|nr:shikimate dehydrogenase [Flavihumibacter sp. CACIAM 22H1]KYP16068.1 MAG: shikimate dehydrogenase [Flavihumibacter sp. CACIAM 22H1]